MARRPVLRHHRDRRALAIRAADVDHRAERAIRRAELIEQLAHAVEAELHPEATGRHEPLQQLGVRHRLVRCRRLGELSS